MSVKFIAATGATRVLPVTISWRSVPLEISVPLTEIADRAGAVRTGRSRLRPRTIRIEGPIYYPDPAMIRSEVDAILELLSHPPIQVYQHHEDERYLLAWPTGASQEWIDARREAQLSVTLVAPDPYWYGAEVVVTETDADEWTVEVGGSAGALPVIRIEFAASGSDAVIRNDENGLYVHVSGSLQNGDVLTIDTVAFMATLQNGGLEFPIIDRLNDEFLAYGFELVSGENNLEYTGPAADVTLTYRPRSY